MDSRISTASRPDVVVVESAPRPTPTPLRVTFGQVLAAGANGLVQGAELVASKLPGTPLAVAAVRGAVAPGGAAPLAAASSSAPEGPGGPSLATGPLTLQAASTDPTGGIDASLQQSAQLNLYYLQVQEEVDAQNRSFTALSNVLKTEHDSAKAAIQNIHS